MANAKRPVAVLIVTAMMALSLMACGKSAVQEAIESIDSIGEVTLDSGTAIEQAQDKFEALSEEEKGKVNNVASLLEAENRYQELLVEKNCFDLICSKYQEFEGKATPSVLSIEAANKISEAISGELDAITAFDESSIDDQSYRSLLDDYKASLQSRLYGLENYPNDAATYNLNYIGRGANLQADCFARFEADFGLRPSFDFEKREYPQMGSIGEPFEIETEKGSVEITIEGFDTSDEDTDTVRKINLANSSQECGFLLCVIRNVSHQVSNDSSGYLRLDELGTISDMNGVQLTKIDGSLRYPGYECGGAGVMGLYPGSDIQVGEAKRIGIPCIVGSDATEVCFQMKTGEFIILPVNR